MRALRAAGLVAAGLLAACGGRAAVAPAPRGVPPGAEALLAAQLEALGEADLDRFAAAFAPDVIFIGRGAAEAVVGRDAAMAELARELRPWLRAGAVVSQRAGERSVGIAPDRRAVWAAQEIELTLRTRRAVARVPYRVTSLAAETEGGWRILAQHWSVALADEVALRRAAAGGLPPPEPLGDDVGPGAEPLVAALEQGLADPGELVASITDRRDAFAFGGAAGAPTGSSIQAGFDELIDDRRLRLGTTGGVRAGLAPSGTVGWVATNLESTVETDVGASTVPYRALFVYLVEDDRWRVVQLHLSIGQ